VALTVPYSPKKRRSEHLRYLSSVFVSLFLLHIPLVKCRRRTQRTQKCPKPVNTATPSSSNNRMTARILLQARWRANAPCIACFQMLPPHYPGQIGFAKTEFVLKKHFRWHPWLGRVHVKQRSAVQRSSLLSSREVQRPDVFRLVEHVRHWSSRTSMVVHAREFCGATAHVLAHVSSYVSTWHNRSGADAPSLLAAFPWNDSRTSLMHQPLKATERWCFAPRRISLRNTEARCRRSLPWLT